MTGSRDTSRRRVRIIWIDPMDGNRTPDFTRRIKPSVVMADELTIDFHHRERRPGRSQSHSPTLILSA
jgi:hypothetical protein